MLIFIGIIVLSLIAVYFSGATLPAVSIALLFLGALGVYASGRISNNLWKQKDPDGYANRIPPTPESHVVPSWISFLNLISYGLIIYALATLAKKYFW